MVEHSNLNLILGLNKFQDNKIQKLLLKGLEIEENPLYRKFELDSVSYLNQLKAQKRRYFGTLSIQYARNQFLREESTDYAWSSAIVYTIPLFENFTKSVEVQSSRAKFTQAQYLARYKKMNSNHDIKISETISS